jgi:hypothetical protein
MTDAIRDRAGARSLWLSALAALAVILLCMSAPAARAEGHQADSDDYNCNHGAPDDPATFEACRRLHGYTVSGGGAGFVTVHVVRDLGTHYLDGRIYRSAREAIEFNCAAGERRRVGYVLYSGHGASGARIASNHTPGAWRSVPPSALPYACR